MTTQTASSTTRTMDEDDNYGFDVAGYILLPKVLSSAEVAACNRSLDAVGEDEGMLAWPEEYSEPFRYLGDHPVLQNFLETLCGADFAMDEEPCLLAGGSGGNTRLDAGDPERNRRFRYVNNANTRICHGVRVIWALDPDPTDGVLVLVPASHRRTIEPPAGFLNGDEDFGMTEEVHLQAGDLLICAAMTIWGIGGRPGRLLQTTYASARCMPSSGFPEIDAPEWFLELTPEQQAVVGTRTTGRGGKVVADGEQTRCVVRVEAPASVVMGLDDASQPDPDELWFWDVRGYLVLRQVMDTDWLAAANRAIDATLATQEDLPEGHASAIEEVPEQALRENNFEWPTDTSPRLRGDIHRPRIGGLYQLPKPHCDPFRRMIGHPAIVPRLNWMLGYGFRESTEPMCCVYPTGTTGGSLHGGSVREYAAANGRQLLEQVNVAWALQDESPGFGEDSGGFICVPGSHKSSYPIPRPLTTSIDLPQVYKPSLQAGDVLFFGSVVHGTTAWRSSWQRRTTIQFMGSGNAALPPGRKQVGWRWSTAPENPANRPGEKS